YRGMLNLVPDPNNAPDTCVQFLLASGSGSCEGLEKLDKNQGNFNICTPDTGTGQGTANPTGCTLAQASTLGFDANFAGSDVAADLCGSVIAGGLTRPAVFAATESSPFVNPFAIIANQQLANLLPSSRIVPHPNPSVLDPNSDPAFSLYDHARVKMGLSRDQLNGIFGLNSTCDWRQVDNGIDPNNNTTRAIGAVMRNYLSGTRNNFNATMLQFGPAGDGDIYVPGTGDVINRVNANQWCGTNASECGEIPGSGTGFGFAACNAVNPPALNNQAISVGYVGTDRSRTIDPLTPLDPFDDYPVDLRNTDNYFFLEYNGHQFNKSNVQCGLYDYWSQERLYYDTANFPSGSLGQKAVSAMVAGAAAFADQDSRVVATNEMHFSRSRDGASPFPVTAFTPDCTNR
ncbi:MAG TPA: hypothetical protein VFE84_02475, partial [Patescibacteria group bacterium]|nr:hypothetical protein [Patescibacteria group bacterium]